MDQFERTKKTAVFKRSIIMNGHKTSVSLENEFWHGLREIAEQEHTTVQTLVEQIDRDRNTCNLSSAIRLFVLNHFRVREKVHSVMSSLTMPGQKTGTRPVA
jgi:predicted DNA-binding ribbon-helix-helix protein